MNKIILKDINLLDIIKENVNLLPINEFLIKINYNVDNLYLGKFWNNIKDDIWIYIDNEMVLWLEYNDIKRGKEFIIRLLNKYFKEDEDYKILNNEEFDINNFCSTSKVEQNNSEESVYVEEKRGAHNKQYITVSPDCFKELCMHIGTKKSKEIKKYYIELEKIFKFYLEYQNQYQELLLEEKEEEVKYKEKLLEQKEELINNNENNNEIKHHKFLMEKFENKKVIYILKIIIDELILIKIGYSDNIKYRINGLVKDYGEKCIFLNIFECVYNREIEQVILHNKQILENKYKNKIKDKLPTEIIILNDNFTYGNLISIVKLSILKYVDKTNLITIEQTLQIKQLLINNYDINDIHYIINSDLYDRYKLIQYDNLMNIYENDFSNNNGINKEIIQNDLQKKINNNIEYKLIEEQIKENIINNINSSKIINPTNKSRVTNIIDNTKETHNLDFQLINIEKDDKYYTQYNIKNNNIVIPTIENKNSIHKFIDYLRDQYSKLPKDRELILTTNKLDATNIKVIYRNFCKKNELKIINQNQFKEDIEQYGMVYKPSKQITFYIFTEFEYEEHYLLFLKYLKKKLDNNEYIGTLKILGDPLYKIYLNWSDENNIKSYFIYSQPTFLKNILNNIGKASSRRLNGRKVTYLLNSINF
jgi:hypothetical protein